MVVVVWTVVVVVAGAAPQPDGSGAQSAAAQLLARNFFASSFFAPLQWMQKRVPVPNCTCAFTVPCVPLSASEKVTPDLMATRSLPFFSCAELFEVLSLNFQSLFFLFVQPEPAARVAQKLSLAL